MSGDSARPGRSLWRAARWRVYGAIVGWSLIVVWTLLVSWLVLAMHPVSSDWNMYYDTARALRASPHIDLALYSTTAWGGAMPGGCALWAGDPYRYPPLLAVLLAPLTILPCAPATMIWRLLSLGLWLASAAMVALPALRARAWGWALADVALFVFYLPLIDGMLLGQAHLVILACCLQGAALASRGRGMLSGGALALGAWIKYVPAAIIAYYALIGRWRVALSALVVGLLLLVGQLLIVGPTSLLESLMPAAATATGAAVGAAWLGLPGGMLWGVAACAVFAVGVLLARRFGAAPPDEALGVGWALCTALLLSPIVWWLYLTWLLPAFWACLRAVAQPAAQPTATLTGERADVALRWPCWSRWSLWALRVGLAVALALTLIPFYHPTIALGTFLLWIVCGALYLRSVALRLPGRLARATAHAMQRALASEIA